jgi:hypothetical protein
VHTSTVTVAVLPEAEETDIEIRSEDLRIDVYIQAALVANLLILVTPQSELLTFLQELSLHARTNEAN